MYLFFISIQTKIVREKGKINVLINEHNRLSFAVKEKEARLKTLQKTLQTMDAQPADSNTEDACMQVSVWGASQTHTQTQLWEKMVLWGTINIKMLISAAPLS